MFEKRLINIKDIEILGDMYPRNSINAMAIEEYAEAMKSGVKFPHIDVVQRTTFNQALKKYILIDGRHRIEATEMNGGDHIQANVHKRMSEEEIYLMAIELNAGHGVRLTRLDKFNKIIPKLREMKIEPARISEIVRMSVEDITKIAPARMESRRDVSSMHQRVGVPDIYHEAKSAAYVIRGGFDITIEDAKGGVFLKAKEKTANVLKEFVGSKMRMKVENNSIILQRFGEDNKTI